MLTFGELVVTGELAPIPLSVDAPSHPPAAATVPVLWHGVEVGVMSRFDWVHLPGGVRAHSTYQFTSCSGKTQVAGRDREAVLRNVNEALLELMPTPDALQS